MGKDDSSMYGNITERLKYALNLFGKTSDELEQNLQILKAWIKTQEYLPETPGTYIYI